MSGKLGDNYSTNGRQPTLSESELPPRRARPVLRWSFASILAILSVLGLSLMRTSQTSLAQEVIKQIVPGPKPVSSVPRSECHAFELVERGSKFLGRRDVPASLGWVESGFVTDDKIIMPDFTFAGMKGVSVGGYVDRMSLTDADTGEPVQLESPLWTYPRSDGSGYLLLDFFGAETSFVMYVSADGEVERWVASGGISVKYGNRPGELRLTDVTRMVPYGDGLVVSADFLLPDKQRDWWRAFGYLDSVSNTFYPFEIEDGLSEKDRRRLSRDRKEKYYGRDFNFVSVVGDTAYLLVMDNVSWIGSVNIEKAVEGDSRVRRLAEVPEDFSPLPEKMDDIDTGFTAHLEAVKGIYSIYQLIERSRMPVGIHSWKGRLFLLAKGEADPFNGRTDWFLVEVSPGDGRELGRIQLPTQAEQVSLARGHDFIGFIEKESIGMFDSLPLRALYRPARSLILADEDLLFSGGVVADKKFCQLYSIAD